MHGIDAQQLFLHHLCRVLVSGNHDGLSAGAEGFRNDAKKLGRPTGFKINVREVYVSAGAGFVVAVNGSIMTLPGLPKKPAAYGIDVNDDGVITGLF